MSRRVRNEIAKVRLLTFHVCPNVGIQKTLSGFA
jgi:hypothetical protein